MPRFAAIAVLAAVACATACTAAVHGTAGPESYSLPPDFPDMAGYTVIGEDAPFWHAQGKWIGWSFSGPGGIDCTVELFGAYDAGRVGCEGALPGRGPGTWGAYVTESSTVGVLAYLHPEPIPADALPPDLPPRHVIRDPESGLVCGRADGTTLACRVRTSVF